MRSVFTIIHEKSRIDRVEHMELAGLLGVTLQPYASALLVCILFVITIMYLFLYKSTSYTAFAQVGSMATREKREKAQAWSCLRSLLGKFSHGYPALRQLIFIPPSVHVHPKKRKERSSLKWLWKSGHSEHNNLSVGETDALSKAYLMAMAVNHP